MAHFSMKIMRLTGSAPSENQHAKACLDEYELVIDHLGDPLAYQIGRGDKTETELVAARAEIGRLQAQAEERIHDC